MDGRVKYKFWKCSVAVLLIVTLAGARKAGQTTPTGGAEEPEAEKKTPAPSVASAPDTQQHQIIDRHGSDEKLRAKVKAKEERDKREKEHRDMMDRISDDTGHNGETWEVSMKCLNCLCYFATDCDLRRDCEIPTNTKGLEKGMEKGDCGPFHISMPFWADGNKKDMDTGDAAMEKEWKQCSLDLICSTKSIQKYFHKYPVDCNGDGKVDCVDYAAIHTLGPYGCKIADSLEYWNENRREGLLQCMLREEEGAYTVAMHKLQEKMNLQDIAGRKNELQKETKSSEPVGTETAIQEDEHKVHTEEESTGKVEAKTNADETDAHEHVQDQNEHDAHEHGSHNAHERVALQ